MYSSRNAPRRDQYYEEDYEGVEDQYEEEDGGEEYYEDAMADISLRMDDNQHLTRDMISGAQRIMLDIDLMASPEELAQGQVLSVIKLAPHVRKHLKQITTTKDRDKAGPEEMAGNLTRCIPLYLEIVEQCNSFPYAMGLKIPGMVAKTLHENGRSHWRVTADTPPMMVNRAAFEPSNFVTASMYQNYRMISPESLAEDIKHHPNDGISIIRVHSLPYDSLVANLEAGHWPQADIDFEAVFNAKERRHPIVHVPIAVGRDIEESLRTPVEEAAKAFINLEDFAFEVERADGEPAFDSPNKLHGELVGAEFGADQNLRERRLLKRCQFHVKAELTYCLF